MITRKRHAPETKAAPFEHEPIRATDEDTFPHAATVPVEPPTLITEAPIFARPTAKPRITIVLEGPPTPGLEERARELAAANGDLAAGAEILTQLTRTGYRGTVTLTVGDDAPKRSYR